MKNQTKAPAGKLKQNTGEVIDISDNRLYYKVTISSRKRCDSSDLW